jgi:hypothetical protein
MRKGRDHCVGLSTKNIMSFCQKACFLKFAGKKRKLPFLQHSKIPITCQMAIFEKSKPDHCLKNHAESRVFVLPGSVH